MLAAEFIRNILLSDLSTWILANIAYHSVPAFPQLKPTHTELSRAVADSPSYSTGLTLSFCH